MVLPVVDQQ
jgi:hypothetical protein